MNENKIKQIESVAFFKTNIKPAWEDPLNEKGGEFHLRLVDPYPQEIDDLWRAIVFDLMSGDLGMAERVSFLRITMYLILFIDKWYQNR